MGHRLPDGFWCYFIEGNAADVALCLPVLQGIAKVEGDCLSFAVIIRGQQDDVGFLRLLLQLFEDLGLSPHRDVFGLEGACHVDGQPGLGQVDEVPHGGSHRVALAEVFFDGFSLCGGLDNEQDLLLCRARSARCPGPRFPRALPYGRRAGGLPGRGFPRCLHRFSRDPHHLIFRRGIPRFIYFHDSLQTMSPPSRAQLPSVSSPCNIAKRRPSGNSH